MAPHVLLNRAEPPAITKGYIRAIIIIGIIAFIILLSLLCLYRLQLFRANKKKSVVRPPIQQTFFSTTSKPFSRDRLTASIVMPAKAVTPPQKAVASSHIPPPTSFRLNSRSPLPNAPHAERRSRAMSNVPSSDFPRDRSSSGFSSYAQYRFPPGLSSRSVSPNILSSSLARTVHQSFESSLPDELALRCGERLTVLRSFDDGWCVVVRDVSRSPRSSLLSPEVKKNGDNVDIGLVPIWVFSTPPHGIPSSRPFRNTSLGALRQGHNSACATRDGITSWANFG